MPCVTGRIRIGMSKDNVNHPSHYEAGPFECIELTRLYPFAGGNAIKYVFRHRAKNGVEDLEKALWYLDHATVDELRPMPCASNSKACHLLRVLERADWQVMAPFWKGMWELAQGYDSGLTRAHRAVDRRVRLLETPLTDDELKLLDGWSRHGGCGPVASNTECRLRYAPFRPIATTIDEKRRKDRPSDSFSVILLLWSARSAVHVVTQRIGFLEADVIQQVAEVGLVGGD